MRMIKRWLFPIPIPANSHPSWDTHHPTLHFPRQGSSLLMGPSTSKLPECRAQTFEAWGGSAPIQHTHTHTPICTAQSSTGHQRAYFKYLNFSTLRTQTQNEKCMTYSWYLFFMYKYLLFCHKINSTLDANTF